MVFNEAGLWQAAYGSVDKYKHYFPLMLNAIPATSHTIWLNTVAIHPIHFKSGLQRHKGKKKWHFTEPRIELINQLSQGFVKHHNQANPAKQIQSVNIWSKTILREDAPKSRHDMRHYKDTVYMDIIDQLLLSPQILI